MHIAIAGGHSKAAPGASGYLDEYQCDRAYVARLVDALRAAGHTVTDCTNEKTTSNAELAEEVRIANGSGADVFMAVHFNAGGGTGTECWYWSGSNAGRKISERMSANVAAALGLRDRGAKDTTNLYVIRNTNMTAILLEVCFVDSQQDADAWNASKWEDLTAAVVNAFGGKQVAPNQAPAPQPSSDRIDEDGWWGIATTRKLQQYLGTTEDGVVSAQDARDFYAVNRGGLKTSSWQIGGVGASNVIRALQRKIGVYDDGYFGKKSCVALQQYLGTCPDGYVDDPSKMVMELQSRLNQGSL